VGTPTISEVFFSNTLIANNTTPVDPNCTNQFGGFVSLGNNLEDRDSCGLTAATDLVDIDPQVGKLRAYGNSPATVAPLPR